MRENVDLAGTQFKIESKVTFFVVVVVVRVRGADTWGLAHWSLIQG